jgi:hypothetical protein
MKTEYCINLPSDIRTELKLLFGALDVTRCGSIETKEAALLLRSLGFPANNEDIKEALLELDAAPPGSNPRCKSSHGMFTNDPSSLICRKAQYWDCRQNSWENDPQSWHRGICR